MWQSQQKPSLPSRIWEQLFRRSWWVWAFALLCHGGYDLASRRQLRVHDRLEQLHAEKTAELVSLQATYADLERQIQSQSDPAYVELVLCKGLGVVPEGATKVYFAP